MTNFYNIEYIFVLYDFWGTKCYFGILDNLHGGQKVVLWFGEGQKYQFLFCHLPTVCLVPKTNFTNQTLDNWSYFVISFIF